MTESVTVTVVLELKPEAVEPFCQAMPKTLEATGVFAGFRDIRLLRHKDNPNRVIMIEEWDSVEAYQAYVAWRQESGAMDGFADLLAAAPKLDFWTTRVA